MKQLLFLLLFPCFALAQYQGNSNQKITLGEQTTADGLVWRGRLTDTSNLLTNKLDTSVYIVLDTGTRAMWYYRASTTPKWNRVVDSLNNLQGTLSVAKGGTGSATQNFVDLTTAQTVAGAKTFNANAINIKSLAATGSTVLNFYNSANVLKGQFGYGSSVTNELDFYSAANAAVRYWVSSYNDSKVMIRLDTSFRVTINGNFAATEALDVNGNARIRSVGDGTFSNNLNITSDGTLTTATSDEKYKYNILPISYGLNTILKLKPVNFQWIKGEENDLGFIAQDVAEIIPEAVNTNWNSDLLFRYESIIPILTKAIQEQQALIKALEQRILILENK